MKALLYIILLSISCGCYGQLTITTAAGPATNTFSSSITTGSVTFTPNDLFLVAVFQDKGGTPTPTIPTVSGSTTSWDVVATQTYNTISSSVGRITVFRYLSSISVTSTLTISNTNGNADIGYVVVKVTGITRAGVNGSAAIVQSVNGVSDGSADPSISLVSLKGANNAVIAFLQKTSAPFTGTPESGWTELIDSGFGAIGEYCTYRTATTDNTVQVTSASSAWAGIALEITGSRRIFSIN